MNAATIQSTEEFVSRIRSAGWSYAWFRGEPKVDSPLTPKLYRPRPNGSQHHENKLLQLFRMKARTFSALPCPDRGHTDQWLFLAQHVGFTDAIAGLDRKCARRFTLRSSRREEAAGSLDA